MQKNTSDIETLPVVWPRLRVVARLPRLSLLTAVMFAALAGSALAQEGEIAGVVRDPSDAVMQVRSWK